MLKKALASLVLLGAPFAVSASTYILSANTPVSVVHGNSTTPFTDVYEFTISATDIGQAAAVALDLNFGNLFNISGFNVYWDAASPTTAAPFALTSTTTTASGVLEASGWQTGGLTAGTYIFDVTGIADGLNGGAYLASYSVLPISDLSSVPVPAAVWLFGSAFVGLVGVSRRRVLS